jgi:maleylacetoacetate isomerase
MITLYSYCRSSTAYRVRIGLHLKGLPFKTIPVNLLKSEQTGEPYKKVNPSMGVPTLVHDGYSLTQSLAILNYIDNIEPEPPLAFGSDEELAYVREIALTIATDIHPLVNVRVMAHLGMGDEEKVLWYRHWVGKGMDAVEELLARRGWHGQFAHGDNVSVADLCIVPMMYSMRRNKIDLSPYPICRKIEMNCIRLDAFQKAAPETQPDAPEGLEQIHGPNSPLLKESQK